MNATEKVYSFEPRRCAKSLDALLEVCDLLSELGDFALEVCTACFPCTSVVDAFSILELA